MADGALKQKKVFSGYREPSVPYGHLYDFQIKSYQNFLENSLEKLFEEFFPVEDFNKTKFIVDFVSYSIRPPKFTTKEAKENFANYSANLRAVLKLTNKKLGTVVKEELNFGEIPLITESGTFIIKGVERVIISQLIRSSGVIFKVDEIKGKRCFGAKIIPEKGDWIEFETDINSRIFARINRRKRFPATLLLRFFGINKVDDLLNQFDTKEEKEMIKKTILAEELEEGEDVNTQLYRHVRDGDPANKENAKKIISTIFHKDRFDLSEIGRVRLNKRIKQTTTSRVIRLEDLVGIMKEIARLNNTPEALADDIDHLGLRRVRLVGEQVARSAAIGFSYMRKNMQDKMSVVDADTAQLAKIINQKVFSTEVLKYFKTGELSQVLKKKNVLDELEHLRTVSALGPGGLATSTRAGFEVRDIHPSHYGRICPIHTPDGQNVGVVLHLALYARIHKTGLLETPYFKVKDGVVTDELVYMTAYDEEQYKIAHAGVNVDEKGIIQDKYVLVRHKRNPVDARSDEVDYIDVATSQSLSVATNLIPFMHHDMGNRVLFGSTMQRQAIPCIFPEAPIVATGYETMFQQLHTRLVMAKNKGVIEKVDARHIVVKTSAGKDSYELSVFPSNDGYAFHQRPIISLNQKINKGDVLADIASSRHGQFAIGRNLKAAFLCWSGANYEDAIVISKRLVHDDTLTSVHMETLEVDVLETKLGPEVTTYDIPNISETKLRNLDEQGIIRIGSDVEVGDILVGKVTPRGEYQLTPEERLLQSIFGERAKDIKDTSLKVPAGKKGKVIDVRIFTSENSDNLDAGILKKIKITLAEMRIIQEGDKLCGRHGNKGVISKVLPPEDMPYTEDGEPVDIVLTPLGIPSRQNIGQLLELHLGLAANTLDYQALIPAFSKVKEEEIRAELVKAGFPSGGKIKLYDGRTGRAFANKVAVGYMYMLKLDHMVEDKIHVRSMGQYSLVSQQPLAGRSRGGGQRLGEMEVWALLGYGAAYTLREMLTIKSDDILGRSAAFDAMVRGEKISRLNTPASFNVLIYYLRALGINILFKNTTTT